MKWFKNVSNIEDLKKEYKILSKKLHPDLNSTDTTSQFVEMKAEFDKLLHFYKTNPQNMSKEDEKHSFNSDFTTIIDKLNVIDDLIVEIVGTWVWVSGNTYNNRQIIKDLGFKWSKSNKKWYWTEQELSKGRRKAISWEKKVEKYGCTRHETAKKSRIM